MIYRLFMRNKALAQFSLIIMIFLLSGIQVAASTNYTFSDSNSSIDFMGGGTYIFENHMVWSGTKNGGKHIFYKNLTTSETKQITNIDSPKESAKVGVTKQGDIVVIWTDKRSHGDKPLWDIYSYNLTTEKETKLNSTDGQYVVPTIDGDHVVWHNLTGSKMYVYDLATKKEEYIGDGRYPIVKDGKVVFKNPKDGGLTLYSTATKEKEAVLELPSIKYVSSFTFNGKNILWSESDRETDRGLQYRLMDIDDTNNVIDLTPIEKPKAEYSKLALGENYAAWLQEKDGVAQIMGAKLESGQTFQMTNGTTNQRLIGIDGDQVIMVDENKKLVYRETTEKVSNQQPSNHTSQENNAQDTLTKEIGPEGGSIEMNDEGLILTITPNTFQENTQVTVKKETGSTNDPRFVQVSSRWEIQTDKPFKKKLVLQTGFDKSKLSQEQIKKLGVYDEAHHYLGGQINHENDTIQIEISKNGRFTVLLYDKTFEDIKGHWAQQSIEMLTSRWIVNGVNEQEFKPNHQLTRAEFAKMLVSAQGLDPVSPNQASFTDVNLNHWSYQWIEAAKEAGIITGNAKGQFLPNEKVSREEMMTMLVRTIGESNLKPKTNDELASFKDSEKVSGWAKPYVEKAIQSGLISGSNGNVSPLSSSTRAEAAVVIYRMVEQGTEQ